MRLDETRLIGRADSRLAREDVIAYRSSGQWRGIPLVDDLRDAVARVPDRIAVVDHQLATGRRRAWTYRETDELVTRLAAGMTDRGLRPGDGVAVMLPNRAEFVALLYAIFSIGAVYSGIPASYGLREAAYIVNHAQVRMLVVPRELRGRDFAPFVAQLRERCPALELVVMVTDAPHEVGEEVAGCVVPFDDLPAATADARPDTEVHAGDVCHIGFTSGTTGEPKGVMNTHETLGTVLRNWVAFVGREQLGDPMVNLIPSPVGHHSGFLWGVLMTVHLQATMVLVDQWSAPAIARLAAEERVTTMIAAPTFLQDLVDLPEPPGGRPDHWRFISIPGAPIPRALVGRAAQALHCFVCPSWGMTEWGIGISARPGMPADRIEAYDGVAVPGCEVRVVDADGRACAAGEEGDLQIAGAGLFLGYVDRPEATAEAFDGPWFRTGDRAVVTADGYLEIRGRTKDIVIRGGENIPVVEIENLIYAHPDVAEVALIGLPDARLGERACAIVTLRAGTTLTLEQLTVHLLDQGVSKHFLPERVEVVEEIPKTMSGKIRKNELRDRFA